MPHKKFRAFRNLDEARQALEDVVDQMITGPVEERIDPRFFLVEVVKFLTQLDRSAEEERKKKR